jgi:aminomethyltransferase
MMLNENAGIIDDLIVWWRPDGAFWVMPNAGNHEQVMKAFAAEPETEVADLRHSTVFFAVQGPDAPLLLEKHLGSSPGRFHNSRLEWRGGVVSAAGTGYTGERGGELCAGPDIGELLVRALIEDGVKPCGLGARDTLRLEAGLPLWGEDIDETTTPLEAGLSFAVSMGHQFVGEEALATQQQNGVDRLLVGFLLEERGIPRRGQAIRTDGGGVGTVTSGNLSPMLETGMGLGYLSPPPDLDGEALEIEIRGRWVPGHTATPPFHQNLGS